jgi:hypothetical protein
MPVELSHEPCPQAVAVPAPSHKIDYQYRHRKT